MEICRLCCQVTEEIIDIFGGQIIDLPEKINAYLPIIVSATDSFPVKCCTTCVKTLMSFDELVTACIEANKCFEELHANTIREVDKASTSIEIPVTPSSTSKQEFTTYETDNLHNQEEILDASEIPNSKTICIDDTTQQNIISNLEYVPAPVFRQLKRKQTKRKQIKHEDNEQVKEIIDNKVYYKCKLCEKALRSLYTYKAHMKIHTGERPCVCDLCGKQFRIPQGLKRHVLQTHGGMKSFACGFCERKFATKQGAIEHRNIHTNERPYVCDVCGKAFKQKASLFVHNRSHTDYRPFPCEYCNLAFSTKSLLGCHITKHTGVRRHICEICRKTFRNRNDLTRHTLIHSEVKPFKCMLCGHGFRMKRYLNNHLKLNQCEKLELLKSNQ